MGDPGSQGLSMNTAFGLPPQEFGKRFRLQSDSGRAGSSRPNAECQHASKSVKTLQSATPFRSTKLGPSMVNCKLMTAWLKNFELRPFLGGDKYLLHNDR